MVTLGNPKILNLHPTANFPIQGPPDTTPQEQ